MKYQQVFLGEELTVTIRCPGCLHEKVVPFDKLSGKHKIKIRCRCGSVFGVQIELRRRFRKEVHLDGIFFKNISDKKWGKTLSESQDTNIKPINCKVTDVSLTGIGLLIPENAKVKGGDHLTIKFILDNSAATPVEKETIVKSVIGNRIGCEFMDSDKSDATLGFYFL